MGSTQDLLLIVKYNGTVAKKIMRIPEPIASSTAEVNIGLFDVKGRLIAGRNIGSGNEKNRVPVLDLGRVPLSPGVYCIRIRNNGHCFYDRMNLQ